MVRNIVRKTPHFIALSKVENKIHTSRECNFLKKRAKDKEDPRYGKKDYKNKFKEINLFQAEDSHQRDMYLKYKI